MLKKLTDLVYLSQAERKSDADKYIVMAEYSGDSEISTITVNAIIHVECTGDKMFVVFDSDTQFEPDNEYSLSTLSSVIHERVEVKNDLIKLFDKEDIIEYMITKEGIFYPSITKSKYSYQLLVERKKRQEENKRNNKDNDAIYPYKIK
jgi:hypothetical protein